MLAQGGSEAEFGFLLFRNNIKRKPPFLRRNVKQSVKALRRLNMGSSLSKASNLVDATFGPRHQPSRPEDDEDDEFKGPPAKRQKLTSSDENDGFSTREAKNDFQARYPLDQVTNGSTKRGVIDPVNFYGKSRSSTGQLHELRSSRRDKTISSITDAAKGRFQKALRLDFLGIFMEDDGAVSEDLDRMGLGGLVNIQCKCIAAIFFLSHDKDTRRRGSYTQVCDSIRMGLLKVREGPNGLSRDLLLSEPFVFPSQDFFVNRRRKIPTLRPEDDITVGLADAYRIHITIEPIGYQQYWPPFHISLSDDLQAGNISKALSDGRIIRNDIQLTGTTLLFANPDSQDKNLNLKLDFKDGRESIPYFLKVRVSWAVPSHLCTLLTPSKPELQYQPVVQPLASPSNRARKTFDAGTRTGDSRPQRHRSNIPTYNLKHLSAQAQGKSPRKPRSRSRPDDSEPPSEEISITYAFGSADSADNGIEQQYTILGLKCPFCCCNHRSLDELRFHLQSEHHNYTFSLRRSVPSRVTYFVQIIRNQSSMSSERTFQMIKPETLFELEAYLEDNKSWPKAREPRERSHGSKQFVDMAGPESSLSPSPRVSRYSSPNTSNSMDDTVETVIEKQQDFKSRTSRQVFRVPLTTKPLYDTLTKRVLEPGEEILSSGDEKDERWFHQKHRDIINDFSDVSMEEKDYLTRWNPFIVEHNLSCELYMPEAVSLFVERNKGWFSQRNSRKVQLMKHIETFILRGVVPEDCLHKSIAILRAESRKKVVEDANMDKEDAREELPSKHRGLLDCICFVHVQASDRVVCRGQVSQYPILLDITNRLLQHCQSRFFHRKCAENLGRPLTGSWICEDCFSSS